MTDQYPDSCPALTATCLEFEQNRGEISNSLANCYKLYNGYNIVISTLQRGIHLIKAKNSNISRIELNCSHNLILELFAILSILLPLYVSF